MHIQHHLQRNGATSCLTGERNMTVDWDAIASQGLMKKILNVLYLILIIRILSYGFPFANYDQVINNMRH